MTETAPDFSLIHEPWIPVLRNDGKPTDASLIEVIETAEGITQIVGDVPTQVFAIQRLVLAILHRASNGPEDVDHWIEIRDDWPAVVADVRRYLNHFGERFYLFHPTDPFFQVADLRTAKGEVSGLEKLIADVPNGSPYFTTRVGPGLNRITAAEAARWLVHAHAFDPSGIRSGAVGDPRVKGGRGYPVGPGWSGQIGGVSLIGSTLQETFLLNLIAPDACSITTSPDDVPPWERPQLTEQIETGSDRPEPRGLIDLYTWQTRRIRLDGDRNGVTGLVLAQGDKATPQNRQDVEPMTSWRYSDPQTKKEGRTVYMPRLHDPERQFWRGLGALLPYTDAESNRQGPARSRPPAVVTWAAKLRNEHAIDSARAIGLRATGISYGPQNATVEEIVDDVLEVPLSLLAEEAAELELVAIDAVARADDAAKAVAGLARNLAQAAGGDTETTGPADRAREQFFDVLDRPFRAWLASLDAEQGMVAAATAWQQEVRRQALVIADDLLSATGPAAWVGRHIRNAHVDSGKAEAWFRAALAKALPRGYADRTSEEEAS